MHAGGGQLIEQLESRLFLSATPVGLTPAQVRHAYRFDQTYFKVRNHSVSADGCGQIIAVVDAYDAPNINSDFKVFSNTFGLPTRIGRNRSILIKATPFGTPQADRDWAMEISLDVQWAHAIAPQARILLVEAASANTADLLDAINYARNQPGVTAVSMSWGGDESPFETYNDPYLTTPRAHIGGGGIRGGITFVTSSGDNGAPAVWPAVSPNVIAVGGTTLSLSSSNNWKSEVAWAGSGGGPSQFEPTPTHAPDVAYDADPQTGFAIYDSTRTSSGNSGWMKIGGTSAGAPQWAALVAIANQGRALLGKASLDGPSQTITALYNLSSLDFHDITQGNNGYAAGPGYDYVTGLGTPFADRVIKDLAGY